MTSSFRHSLKVAVDCVVRARYLPKPGTPGCCVECGLPWEANTPGCTRCNDRQNSRKPERRARQAERHQERMDDVAYRERRNAWKRDNRIRHQQQAAAEAARTHPLTKGSAI